MVERVPGTVVDFARLGARCREVLSIAQASAVRRGHASVGVDHLLHALLEQDDGPVRDLQKPGERSVERLKGFLESRLERLPPATSRQTHLLPALDALLARATREADASKSRYVTVGHLLIAYLESELPRDGFLFGGPSIADVSIEERMIRTPIARQRAVLAEMGAPLTSETCDTTTPCSADSARRASASR